MKSKFFFVFFIFIGMKCENSEDYEADDVDETVDFSFCQKLNK